MKYNNSAHIPGSTNFGYLSQKQHALKIKNRNAFRAKCRRKIHLNQSKRRKQEQVYLQNSLTSKTMTRNPEKDTTNIYSLFHVLEFGQATCKNTHVACPNN